MIGELYAHALAGLARPEVERADGGREPLAVDDWLRISAADRTMLDRCLGPTLDIGAGPGRLTVALAERGIPALGIDVTPYAVNLARAQGALALLRDVFGQVPGVGRWTTVLLADGNIGIGGAPEALLCRITELLDPDEGRAIVEVGRPGTGLRAERVRLRHAGVVSAWFPWAYVGADRIAEVAEGAGLFLADSWTAANRWFVMLTVALRHRPDPSREGIADGTLRDMRARVAGVSACLAALVTLILLVVRPELDPARVRPLPVVAAAWLVFAVAVWLLRGMPTRTAAALIVGGAIAVQLAALSAPPQNSSDLYRYIWDGRVQSQGIDPYAYPPGAIQVAGLRNEFLWSGTGPGHYRECLQQSATLAAGCTWINRPYVPTIYPPVAEAYFLGVQMAAPADDSTTPIQVAASLCALCTTLVLMYGLRRLGKDQRAAALWGWCPTVALEAGNNAHVDVLAVLLTAVALLMLARATTTGRAARGGVLLGLAIATKMTPVLVLPAVLRRRTLAVVASAAAALMLVYVPHAIAVGGRIVGFLPTYLQQEGYTNGTRFGIIDLIVGGRAASVAAVAILAAVALVVLRRGDPNAPWRGAVAMTAASLAVTTPAYQWYALLLVMLVVLDGRPEWLALAAGGYLAAEPRLGWLTPPHPDAIGYGAGLAIALAVTVIRSRLAARATVPDTPSRSVPIPSRAAEPLETPLAAGRSAGA